MGTFDRREARRTPASRQARRTAATAPPSRLRVAVRNNVHVAANIAEPGSTRHASAVQVAPIEHGGSTAPPTAD